MSQEATHLPLVVLGQRLRLVGKRLCQVDPAVLGGLLERGLAFDHPPLPFTLLSVLRVVPGVPRRPVITTQVVLLVLNRAHGARSGSRSGARSR